MSRYYPEIKSRMNRLSHELAVNGHLTFKQKLRHMMLEIFGHEAMIDTDDLAVTSHCPIVNEDVYRVAKLEMRHLALRKLFNPFKWLELIIMTPVELFAWWAQSGHKLVEQVTAKLEKWRDETVKRNTLDHPLS